MKTVADIREQFKAMLAKQDTAEDGNLEIVNAAFVADEPSIFGEVNEDWCKRELRWYMSQSLSVHDIPPPIPQIWKQVASSNGFINSNYGYLIWSPNNGHQFENAVEALRQNKASRQAVMIYTRPTMHFDAKLNGMRDFICTNTVQMLIRKNRLHYMVNMRSNDVVFGYKGDRHWHDYVFELALNQLRVTYSTLEKGLIFWNAGSLHVYPRHFDLVK